MRELSPESGGGGGRLVEPVLPGESAQPFYSLHANRLYAVQCLVKSSRPRSQISWFNRTAPIRLEPIELKAARELRQDDHFVPPELGAGKRLASFVRYVEQQDGTIR